MVRAFIAIDIDEKKLVDKIVLLQKRLLESSANMKLVEPENIHVTLYFLDDIPENTIKVANDIVKRCTSDQEPFEIYISKLSAFPSIKKPRVIWIGITKNADIVTKIANCLKKHLPQAGFRKETKTFHPHITIARVKRYTSDLKQIMKSLEDTDIGPFIVKSVKLKKSTLTSRGPIYEDLSIINLG